MKPTLAVLLFFSFLSNSYGFINTANRDVSYQQEKDYPSVCKITIRFPSNDDSGESTIGTCTGTLVGPNKIYTAAHCFKRNFSISEDRVDVTCGGQMMGQASEVKIPNANDWGPDVNNPEILQDFAVVTLMFKTKNQPSAVASGPELYFDPTSGNLLPGVVCMGLGFGYTSLTSPPTFGNLTKATYENDLIWSTPNHLIALKPLAGETLLETRFGEGDSGGPMFCQAPGHGMELMGVNDANWFAVGTSEAQTTESILNAVYMHPQQ